MRLIVPRTFSSPTHSVRRSVAAPASRTRPLASGAIIAAMLICLASCIDAAAPRPVDITGAQNASVAVGSEFTISFWITGQSWIVPPAISSTSVIFVKAEHSAPSNNPGFGSMAFYFRATSIGHAVITLQPIVGADSVSAPRSVQMVDVH